LAQEGDLSRRTAGGDIARMDVVEGVPPEPEPEPEPEPKPEHPRGGPGVGRPVACDDSSSDDDELGIVKVKLGTEDYDPLGIEFQEVSIKSVNSSGMAQLRAGRPLEAGMILRAINGVPADRLAFSACVIHLLSPLQPLLRRQRLHSLDAECDRICACDRVAFPSVSRSW
jgi:hypothetical protein